MCLNGTKNSCSASSLLVVVMADKIALPWAFRTFKNYLTFEILKIRILERFIHPSEPELGLAAVEFVKVEVGAPWSQNWARKASEIDHPYD